MNVCLLDINLLLALAWPSHLHHAVAHAWFDRNKDSGWATCPFTQSGFIRISSNPKFNEDAVSPAVARDLLIQYTSIGKHIFWMDSVSWTENRFLRSTLLAGHRQVSDLYLLALAMDRGGRLATLDRGIKGAWAANSAAQRAVELVV